MRQVESEKLKVKSIAQSSFNSQWLKALSFLLFALSFSCTTSGKEEKQEKIADGTWTVTVKGKVGYPQQGQIMIQEVKDGALGWQDTIQLKSNYTYSKKIKLTEPGYYR